MLRKFMDRVRQAVTASIEIDLAGIELDLSPEDVIADLSFGAGPRDEPAPLAQEGRPEAGRVA